LLIAATFLVLTGCQGLSSGGSNNQQQPTQSGILGLTSSALNFGTVAEGTGKTLTVSAKNSGSASVVISSAQSSSSQYALTKPALPLTIEPGADATLSVTFTPKNTGNIASTISLSSDASNGAVGLQLDGDGSAPGFLSANPASLAFGGVLTGNNQPLPGTLTNTGGNNLTISQANISGSGFTITGLSLPLTLVPNQSTTFTVTFAPQSAGSTNGSVSFVSDASDSPLNLPLSGTGLAPGSLSANPPSVNFGNVILGNDQSLPETLTNTSGSTVTITQVAVSGSGFSISGLNLPVTLPANQGANFSVQFSPQSAGQAIGSLNVTSNASNPTLVVPLSGSGVAPGTLSPNPSSVAFGNVQVGHNKTLPETITNTGGSNATITQDSVSGAGYSVSGLNLPLTLGPGDSSTFSVTFAPQSTGTVDGNVTLTSNASNPSLIVPLSGTGTPQGQLSVNPTTLNFGNVVVNNNSSLPASLKATGASVTVTSGVSSSSEFVLSGITFPVTIPAGGTQGFTVTFTPQATGQANATLTFSSDASNSPTVEQLTGNGTAPAHHSVQLNWTASVSQDVIGYNVYRGTIHGGPYSQINPSLDSSTSYTDGNVTNGDTYYYVTTAVDSNNVESTYSNEAEAQIPSN
jgi:hypothetical protein